MRTNTFRGSVQSANIFFLKDTIPLAFYISVLKKNNKKKLYNLKKVDKKDNAFFCIVFLLFKSVLSLKYTYLAVIFTIPHKISAYEYDVLPR